VVIAIIGILVALLLPAGQVGAMGETEAPVDYIPGRYNANTELTAEVKEGGQTTLDFPLVSK